MFRRNRTIEIILGGIIRVGGIIRDLTRRPANYAYPLSMKKDFQNTRQRIVDAGVPRVSFCYQEAQQVSMVTLRTC